MATNLENKIGRVQNNVTKALAALAEKGVSVPTGANSDDLETLIKAIESGGGGAKAESGTFTTNGPITSVYYTIATLDFTPTHVVIIRSEEPSTKYVMVGALAVGVIPAKLYVAYNNGSTFYAKFKNGSIDTASTGQIRFTESTGVLEYFGSQTTSFLDGTYHWIAVRR